MLLQYKNKNVVEADAMKRPRLSGGAVYAAAVILPSDFTCETLNDSKKLTEKQRYELRPLIEKEAIAWAVGCVSRKKLTK